MMAARKLALPFGALSIETDGEVNDGSLERAVEIDQQEHPAEKSVSPLADLERKELLGVGASSRVYLCHHKRTGQLLALKKLTAQADSSVRRMALNEIRVAQSALAKADAEDGKQFLMQFLDVFYEEGDVFFLMELADAGSLDDAIRRSEGVPESVLRALTLQVVRGLNHLHHTLHLIHRDLKPANILLTRTGHVKIADFGVARSLDATAALLQTQCGTSSYMSPERLEGDVRLSWNRIWTSISWCSHLWMAMACAVRACMSPASLGWDGNA